MPASRSGDSLVERVPLREQVYEIVLGRIVSGRLPAGTRLSDYAVARDLGISRTPVREALLRLEAEGMLHSDHPRGFFIPPLAAAEAEELYPILWTLESLAVRLSDPPDAARLRRLRTLNRRFGEAAEPLERQRLDRAFHEELCAGAANERLHRILDGLRAALLRYELAFMAGGGNPGRSRRQHTRLLKAMEAGHPDEASALVEEHWRDGLKALRAHLR